MHRTDCNIYLKTTVIATALLSPNVIGDLLLFQRSKSVKSDTTSCFLVNKLVPLITSPRSVRYNASFVFALSSAFLRSKTTAWSTPLSEIDAATSFMFLLGELSVVCPPIMRKGSALKSRSKELPGSLDGRSRFSRFTTGDVLLGEVVVALAELALIILCTTFLLTLGSVVSTTG